MKIGGKYRIYETIGKGAFATTYKVTNFREQFALKEIKLTRLLSEDGANCELDSHENVPRHENVTTIISHFTENSNLYIVFEYWERGNLNDFAIEKKLQDEVGKLRAARDIVHGLQHLHKHNVTHGNVKPTNVLLTLSHGDKPVFKISDFNLQRHVCDPTLLSSMLTGSKPVKEYVSGECGLILFWAPEVKDGQYLQEGDIFSVGVVLFALFQMRTEDRLICPMIPQESGSEVPLTVCKQDTMKQSVQQTVPASIVGLVQRMLSINPGERPSLQEVVENL